jgi:Na+/alanine symporter
MSASANVASVTVPPAQSRLLLPILVGGAVAGTFDITSAFITFGWGACRGVAAGLLGPGARQGGVGIWLLGLFLHFFIATTIAAVYCLSSRRLTFLREHFFLCGLFYGMAAWIVMNLIVLPLSAIHARGPYQLHNMIQGILVHMFLIALPIAFLNAKLSQSSGPLRGQ